MLFIVFLCSLLLFGVFVWSCLFLFLFLLPHSLARVATIITSISKRNIEHNKNIKNTLFFIGRSTEFFLPLSLLCRSTRFASDSRQWRRVALGLAAQHDITGPSAEVAHRKRGWGFLPMNLEPSLRQNWKIQQDTSMVPHGSQGETTTSTHGLIKKDASHVWQYRSIFVNQCSMFWYTIMMTSSHCMEKQAPILENDMLTCKRYSTWREGGEMAGCRNQCYPNDGE